MKNVRTLFQVNSRWNNRLPERIYQFQQAMPVGDEARSDDIQIISRNKNPEILQQIFSDYTVVIR